MSQKLNTELLKQFMEGFYGYGNPEAAFWFIGKEEHSDGTPKDIQKRIQQWHNRGKHPFEDLRDYHHNIGKFKHFGENAPLQATWKQLIRIYLTATGQEAGLRKILDYQKDCLGDPNGNICLSELLPLPNPLAGKWSYSGITDLDYLQKRSTYKKECARWRAEQIARMIQRSHRPKVVVFYSTKEYYQGWWEVISGVGFKRLGREEIYVAHKPQTLFVITKHPVQPGVSNEYFENVGRFIQSEMNRLK